MRLMCNVMATVVLAFGVTAVAAQQSVTVELTVDSVAENRALMVLPGATHRQEVPLLMDSLRDGHATLVIPVEEEPRMYWIQLQSVMHPLKLMLQQGSEVVHVDTYVDSNVHGGVSFPRFGKAKVSGSPVHEEYVRRNVNRDSIAASSARIEKEFQDVTQNFGRPTDTKNDTLAESPRFKAFMQARADFQKFQTETFNDCFRRNGDSWWGPLLILDNMAMLRPMEKEIFDAYPEEVKSSYYGRLLQNAFNAPSQMGPGQIALPQE